MFKFFEVLENNGSNKFELYESEGILIGMYVFQMFGFRKLSIPISHTPQNLV